MRIKIEQLSFYCIGAHCFLFFLLRNIKTLVTHADIKLRSYYCLRSLLVDRVSVSMCHMCMGEHQNPIKKRAIKHFGSHSISNCALDARFTSSRTASGTGIHSRSARTHTPLEYVEVIICNKLAVFIETVRLKYTHNVKSQRHSHSMHSLTLARMAHGQYIYIYP